MSDCTHPYRKPVGLLWWCYDCKQFFTSQKNTEEPAAVEMPPVIFGIDKYLWKNRAPWPLVPFKIVKKYGWYVSMVYGYERLIMPITRGKDAVFYSARKLDENDPYAKYLYPKGAKRAYWTSGKLHSPVFVTESVADGAYSSQLGSGVGLLSNYYDGSLDEELHNKTVIVAMDGDAQGIMGAHRILHHLYKVTHDAHILSLDKGLDPTDVPLSELKKLIKKQTGVRV